MGRSLVEWMCKVTVGHYYDLASWDRQRGLSPRQETWPPIKCVRCGKEIWKPNVRRVA